MLLYSFSFFVFFSLIFFLYWKSPKKLQWVILLLASYYFYASWQPAYLGIIWLTTIITYLCARGMQKSPKFKKHFLLLSFMLSLGFLFIFKYFNFFSLTLDELVGLSLPQFKILLPIGISFYTLQVVGYMVDVYKGKVKAEKHLGYFALFTCFFPQLTAGPIERSTTLLPQLREKHTFTYLDVSEGAKLFLFGLFKKMVIADNLGIIVDRGFSALPEYKGLSLILIIFFYSWQIYMDFSGYTDMARGVGKMVGINLLENFNFPYLATSVQNFWRRWHISFSTWLRDYIYFPLGGNKKGLPRTILNTLLVFTISGLWHGAAWTFVLWGVLHGTAISLERVGKKFIGDMLLIPHIVQVLYAYSLICIFWVFFRSSTVSDAFYILRNSLVGLKNFLSPGYWMASIQHLFAFDTVAIIITFGLVGMAIALEILQRKLPFLERVNTYPVIVRYAIYVLLLFMIIQLRNAEIKQFIYIQF